MSRLVLIVGIVCSVFLLRIADDTVSEALIVLYGLFCLAVDRVLVRDQREVDDLVAMHRPAPMAIHRPGDLRIRLLGNALTRLR